MQQAQFAVPVRDVERSEQHRQFELSPAWLDHALAESEARSDGSTGSFEVRLKKNGREVLVKGVARANVTMPCARTLEPVPVKLEAEIVLLLSPRSPAPAGDKKGRRVRPDPEAEEQLSAELAARDEYEGDTIQLDGFVREHLLLELPLFPVKSDLPFEATPATDPPPEEAEDEAVDPRLAPLAALAKQLQRTREE